MIQKEFIIQRDLKKKIPRDLILTVGSGIVLSR